VEIMKYEHMKLY